MLPVPTLRLTLPPAPPTAAPVDRETEPELSAVVEPLAMDTTPLEPLVPALADAIVIAPLDVAVPEPLVRLIAPPVEAALVPAAT